MEKIILLVLLGAAAVITQTCGPNQAWDDCGSACRPYCNKPSGETCTTECVEDCFCDEANGYTKRAIDAEDDDCILISECPTCGANEIYKMCGTACQDYCGKPEGTACTEQCVQGCFCKDGFVRTIDNNSSACILEASCP
nr:cysteine-rich venom protein 6-like [Onthophagus taurus]XP_022910527.1 cysteine-rich venom protein 6-like [Onthophagus taurus]